MGPFVSLGMPTSCSPSTRAARNPNTCPTCVAWSSGPSWPMSACGEEMPRAASASGALVPVRELGRVGERAAERVDHALRGSLDERGVRLHRAGDPRRATRELHMDSTSAGGGKAVRSTTWSSAIRSASSSPAAAAASGSGSGPSSAAAATRSAARAPTAQARRTRSSPAGARGTTARLRATRGPSRTGSWVRPSSQPTTVATNAIRDAATDGYMAGDRSPDARAHRRARSPSVDEALAGVADGAAGGTCVFVGTVRDRQRCRRRRDRSHVRSLGGAREATRLGEIAAAIHERWTVCASRCSMRRAAVGRRHERRHRGLGAASRRGVRRAPVRHRRAETRRADLEEGGAHHRRGRLGDGRLRWRRELAIDLGTASTLVYRLGDGIVLDEPTVVALQADERRGRRDRRRGVALIGSGSGDVSASVRCAMGP